MTLSNISSERNNLMIVDCNSIEIENGFILNVVAVVGSFVIVSNSIDFREQIYRRLKLIRATYVSSFYQLT